MHEADAELAVMLAGLSIRPGTHLLGESLPVLTAYLLGYSRAQEMLGRRSIFSGVLLDEFTEWLGRDQGLDGTDYHWKILTVDASDKNAQTMLRLFKEFLDSRGTPVPQADAEDWYSRRGRWAAPPSDELGVGRPPDVA